MTAHPPLGQWLDWPSTSGAVYALGLTYADHVGETGQKPGAPAVFPKRCQPLLPGNDTIATPSAQALHDSLRALDGPMAQRLVQRFGPLPALLDYEVEIGIALLDSASRAQLADPGFVPRFGLFVANDITARSVQVAGEGAAQRMAFWSAAKSFETFLPVSAQLWCPQTPSLDRLPELPLQTRVNGTLRQSASTAQLLYSPRQMLGFAADLAPHRCLQAGDLVLTGTPAGVALHVPRWKQVLAAWLPRAVRVQLAIRSNLGNPLFLRPGDVLEFSAGWLGSRQVRIA